MERLRKKGLEIYEKAGDLGYKLEVKHLDNLKNLPDDPRIPFVGYFNHSAMDDPFKIIYLLQKFAPDRLENAVVPVSEHYAHFENHRAYSLAVKAGRATGFELPEIVQSYRRRGEYDENAKRKEFALDLKFRHLIEKNLDKRLSIIMSPEGHRSKEGTLLPAEAGAGILASIFENSIKKGKIDEAYFVPFGIIYKDRKGDGLHYNPFKKAETIVTIGKPITSSDVINSAKKFADNKKDLAKVSSDILMIHLANLLPEEMLGYYSTDMAMDTIKGRYEQRMDENKKVYVHDNWRK